MMELIVVVTLCVVGYITGRHFEKKHYQSIFKREKEFAHIPVISGEWKDKIKEGDEGLVFGSGVVIGSDYFKAFAASLRNIMGGRMKNYESMLDRGRREAILRTKEKAAKWGAHSIINLRVETATIGKTHRRGGLPCVELFAYGTALRNEAQASEPAKAPVNPGPN